MKINILLLKTALSARKITQRQLSKKTGISEAYMSKIMHGEYGPSQKLFDKIVKAIGIKQENPIYHELICVASHPAPRVRRDQ